MLGLGLGSGAFDAKTRLLFGGCTRLGSVRVRIRVRVRVEVEVGSSPRTRVRDGLRMGWGWVMASPQRQPVQPPCWCPHFLRSHGQALPGSSGQGYWTGLLDRITGQDYWTGLEGRSGFDEGFSGRPGLEAGMVYSCMAGLAWRQGPGWAHEQEWYTHVWYRLGPRSEDIYP